MEDSRCDASDLCRELSGADDSEFTRTYGAGSDRVLQDCPSAVAFADLSPLVVGHALVAPRFHFLSVGQAIREDPAYLPFLEQFLTRYEATFGRWSVFEHGSDSSLRNTPCINHAHLHVLPVETRSVLHRMTGDGLEPVALGDWDELAAMTVRDSPYFLAGDSESLQVALDPPKMPKQYLRIAVGATVGLSTAECDWAAVVRRDVHRTTIETWKRSKEVDGVD